MEKPITIFEKMNESKDKKAAYSKTVALLFDQKILKKDRERSVLVERFGLNGKEIKTLDAIGKDLKITRERVRQIEKSALSKLSSNWKNFEDLKELFKKVEKIIDKNDGVMASDILVSRFIPTKSQDVKEVNAFIFLLHLNKNLVFHNENKEFKSFWRLHAVTLKDLEVTSRKIDDVLDEEKKIISAGSLSKQVDERVEKVENLLIIKKNVMQAEDKKWGLSTWREVNPKNIRDKTYLILKKHDKPLHYKEITEKIASHKLQKKPVTKQAVHNELIRDDRFVLIGRGIYALREWGYTPGVVEEVIKEVLVEEGAPLHKNEIIDRVKQKRLVKETTIILNLQKKSFTRVARATYGLADSE